MLASFFTAMSWFRSWASYFCGYNAVQPEYIGRNEGTHPRENGCTGGQLMLEQIGNIAPPVLLWKSVMARARAATSSAPWD
jgi:hypothetical protein